MARLSKIERASIALLAVMLGALLVFLAVRRQPAPQAAVEQTPPAAAEITTTDSIQPIKVKKAVKQRNKRKKSTVKPQPRRHLDDSF